MDTSWRDEIDERARAVPGTDGAAPRGRGAGGGGDGGRLPARGGGRRDAGSVAGGGSAHRRADPGGAPAPLRGAGVPAHPPELRGEPPAGPVHPPAGDGQGLGADPRAAGQPGAAGGAGYAAGVGGGAGGGGVAGGGGGGGGRRSRMDRTSHGWADSPPRRGRGRDHDSTGAGTPAPRFDPPLSSSAGRTDTPGGPPGGGRRSRGRGPRRPGAGCAGGSAGRVAWSSAGGG